MKISYRQAVVIVAGLSVNLQCKAAYTGEPTAVASPSSLVTTDTVKEPVQILFQQASFWQHRKRGDLARTALQRILSSEPDNLQAMYALGMSYLKENSIQEANNVLKQMAATDSRSGYLPLLSQQIKNNSFDQNRLKRARRLQAEGKSEQALKEYDVLIADHSASSPLALEYYHTMSSVENRRQEAVSGLESMRANNPQDDEIVFTLGQVLTYVSETRRRGLAMLQTLFEKPSYRDRAIDKYRDALLWLNASADDEAYFDSYLAKRPQDQEVADRLQSLISPVIDPSSYSGLLSLGFESLNNNKLQQAKKFFTQATEKTEDNAEAWAGLGLIEQRNGLHASALKLYDKALAKDASLASKYQSAIDSARFWSSIGKINQPNYQNNPRAALSYLASLKTVSASEKLEVALQRSVVYSRAKRFEQAAQNYEQILRDYPGEERALVALLKIVISAEDYRRLASLYQRYKNKLNQPSSGKALQSTLHRAHALLQLQKSEMNAAAAAFERALSIDPNDVWIRLDYARLLLTLKQTEKAERIAEAIDTSGADKVEGSYALALFYADIEDWANVVATLDSIPRSAETTEVAQLRLTAEFRQELDHIMRQQQFSSASILQEELMALYESSRQVDGAASLIVAALQKLNLRSAAIAIIRETLVQNPIPSINARLAFAGYLTQWNEFDLADAIITQLDNERRLTTKQLMQRSAIRVQLLQARSAFDIDRQAYSQAQANLNAALSLDPGNSQTLRMLGQVNQLQGYLNASMQRYMEAISVDPTDLWAVKGAVGAALQAQDLVIAREVLDNAIQQFPREPDIYDLLSRVARAAGDGKTAIESTAYARLLRQQSSNQ